MILSTAIGSLGSYRPRPVGMSLCRSETLSSLRLLVPVVRCINDRVVYLWKTFCSRRVSGAARDRPVDHVMGFATEEAKRPPTESIKVDGYQDD